MDPGKLAALHLLQLLGAGLPTNVTTISGNSVIGTNISHTASQATPKPKPTTTITTSAVAPKHVTETESLPKPWYSPCHTSPCTTVSIPATVTTGTMSSSAATPTYLSSSTSMPTVSELIYVTNKPYFYDLFFCIGLLV